MDGAPSNWDTVETSHVINLMDKDGVIHQGYFLRLDKAPPESQMKLYNCFQRLKSTPGDYKFDTGVKLSSCND